MKPSVRLVLLLFSVCVQTAGLASARVASESATLHVLSIEVIHHTVDSFSTLSLGNRGDNVSGSDYVFVVKK